MDSPIRLLVDVVPGSSPISGSVSVADGPPQTFAGFLELMALVDRAASAPAVAIGSDRKEPERGGR